MKRKQSLPERLERLNKGCCPIHGSFMLQIDSWYYPEKGKPYTIVGCTRKNCEAKAIAYDFEGPWEISPDCGYLLDENIDLALLPQNRKPEKRHYPRITRKQLLAKTNGLCYYCGEKLEFLTFTADHIVPQVSGGEDDADNLVPCCKSCNSAKGSKSLDDFRFYREMQKFQQKTGVAFSQRQVEYLESLGVRLDIPAHNFWFEAM